MKKEELQITPQRVTITSTVTIRISDINEKEKYKIMPCGLCKKEGEQVIEINLSLGQALIGAKIGDCVQVKDNPPYEVEILDIENETVKELLMRYYRCGLEKKLLNPKKEIFPFPFEKKLYIGAKEQHSCQGKRADWEEVEVALYYKGGLEKRKIQICKNCGVTVLESMPYKEEKFKDFYRLYDINDGEFLSRKIQMTPLQDYIAHWQSFVIQGGSFTGK